MVRHADGVPESEKWLHGSEAVYAVTAARLDEGATDPVEVRWGRRWGDESDEIAYSDWGPLESHMDSRGFGPFHPDNDYEDGGQHFLEVRRVKEVV